MRKSLPSKITLLNITFLSYLLFLSTCSSKSDPSPTTNTSTKSPTTCIGTSNLTISLVSVTNTGCGTKNGSIVVSGSGGKGALSYSINGGASQSSGIFNNLAPGEYTLVVQDSSTCVANLSTTIKSGISYTSSVASIIKTNCAVSSCHISGGQSPDFSVFSNIQNNSSSIKSRITAKTMPPPTSGRSLSDSDIQSIKCWVDDGAPNN